MKRFILIPFLVFLLSGCQKLGMYEQMGDTEYGMRFWNMPYGIPFLPSGVGNEVFGPGDVVIAFPFSDIHRFDTSVRDITWGAEGKGSNEERTDYVQTRALDGNELALGVTVRYRISTEPERLRNLLTRVATSNEDIEKIVITSARADIRTFMNELETDHFIPQSNTEQETETSGTARSLSAPRYEKIRKVRDALAERLAPYGIDIIRVNLDGFKFRRVRRDSTIDFSYEEAIKQVQEQREKTRKVEASIATLVEEKERELNDMQAHVNQLVQEAEGYLQQAKARGDAYLVAKRNESEAILALGRAQVQGVTEQINALTGPGGTAILKLELAKQLLKNDPKFVLLGEPSRSEGIEVKKVDTNDLIRQIGVLEGISTSKKSQARRAQDGPVEQASKVAGNDKNEVLSVQKAPNG